MWDALVIAGDTVCFGFDLRSDLVEIGKQFIFDMQKYAPLVTIFGHFNNTQFITNQLQNNKYKVF